MSWKVTGQDDNCHADNDDNDDKNYTDGNNDNDDEHTTLVSTTVSTH